MSSTRRRIRTSSLRAAAVVLLCGTFIAVIAVQGQQVYLQAAAPEDQFGDVTLNQHVTLDNGPVVFNHWLHRAKFTCRLCHVDIGFAMVANGTGINAKTNEEGFYCGACHDGKRQFGNVTVFASCRQDGVAKADVTCSRCHASSKTTRKYSYREFTAKLPKARYGIDWMAAENAGVIKPIDVIDGLSIAKQRINNHAELAIAPQVQWFTGIHFSHELHTKWNSCELCHPDIFPTQRDRAANMSMYQIANGRFCGACHVKVAFPINGCNQCHANGPMWVNGPGWIM